MSNAKLAELVDDELLPSRRSSSKKIRGSSKKARGSSKKTPVEALAGGDDGEGDTPVAVLEVSSMVRVTEGESGGIGNGAVKRRGKATATAIATETLNLVSAMEVEEGSSDKDEKEDEKIVMATGESNVASETVSAVRRPLDGGEDAPVAVLEVSSMVRVTEGESGGIGNGAGKRRGKATATAIATETLNLVSAMEVEEGSSDKDEKEDEKIVMATGESNVASETVSAVRRPLDGGEDAPVAVLEVSSMVRVTEGESGGIGNGAGKRRGKGTATETLNLASAMEVEEGSSDEDENEDEKIVVATGESNVASETVSAVRRPLDVARVKTSLCSYFRRRGCRHGENCVYAHGESELQQRPDGTWDPTSERAKNVVAVEKMESVAGAAAAPEQAGQFQKCIVHVPRGWSQIKLKSFLDEHNVPYTSAKKRKAMSVCFVGFDNQEQVTKSAQILDGMSVQNKRLKFADVLPRAWEQKAVGVTESALANASKDKDAEGEDKDAGGEDINEGGLGDEPSDGVVTDKKVLEPYRDVAQVVTPLAHLKYEDQLSTKKDDIVHVLKRLARSIRKGCPPGILLPDWLAAAKDREGLPCEFEGVIPSPLVDGYRNKCEFSIGSGPDGKRVVGFQLGTFREGVNAVAEPGNCRNVSSISIGYVAAFQSFIRMSKLPVWNKTDNTGFWRMLTIREGRKPVPGAEVSSEISEVMLIVQVCPTGVPADLRAQEYSQMAKALIETATTATPQLPLTALLIQDHVGVSNAAPADSPLHPLPLPGLHEIRTDEHTPVAHIHDYIDGLRFRISPTAFFQVNTAGAERLYSLAGDWAGIGPDTLLFDVCCGTGAIGLTLAKRVGMVVGIEMNASAVADAQLNAELNGISNCHFVCGKAEDVISDLLKQYAVEDPSEEKMTETTAVNGKGQGSCDEQVVKPVEKEKRQFTNIVAIVDPPRVGLHHVVLRTLRLHKQLRRLVYISCNPDSLLANAVELCMPLKTGPPEKVKARGGFRGTTTLGHARRRVKTLPASEPFRPVKSTAVDLFPHTKHCEMVMLFER